MKRFNILTILLLLFFAEPLSAAEIYIEYGEIIETSGGDNEYIQVRDKILQIRNVYIDNGNGKLVTSKGKTLQTGDIVKCFITEEEDDFWQTEKVILLRGSARSEILKESDMVLLYNENKSIPEVSRKKRSEGQGSSEMFLENGVWHN